MPLIATARGDIWIEHTGRVPLTPDAERPAPRPTFGWIRKRREGQTEEFADESKPLLLIHGAGGLHSDWDEALRARGIALDLPAHGNSPGAIRTTVAESAEDVIALLDALGIDRAIMVGHSLGGAVALTLALDFPARVSGLILVATGAKLTVHPDILMNIESNLEAAAVRLSGWFWTADVDAALKERHFAQFLTVLPGILFADFAAANAFDARGRLSEIQTPTLIVCGADDVMTPPKFSGYLHEKIAGSRLVLIEGAGHMLPLEKPEALDTAIAGWLAETTRNAAQ